jgi:multimeric flavodoxin WrbA
MIKIVGISGSPVKDGNTETFLKKALEFSESIGGVETEFVSLAEKKVNSCRHCNWCVAKQKEGKPCALDDDMQEIYPIVLEADGLLLATPVYLGRLSGYMASFLDRLRAFVHGNLYHRRLDYKTGGAMSVGWLRHGGLETALFSLIQGFMSVQMIPVGAGLSCAFGAPAVTSRDGKGEFDRDQKLGILEDEFGLKNMEYLVERLVKVTKKLQEVPSI